MVPFPTFAPLAAPPETLAVLAVLSLNLLIRLKTLVFTAPLAALRRTGRLRGRLAPSDLLFETAFPANLESRFPSDWFAPEAPDRSLLQIILVGSAGTHLSGVRATGCVFFEFVDQFPQAARGRKQPRKW